MGECRDQEKKEASFFALHENSGQEVWSGLTFDEPWWVGIETAHRGMMIFHGYAQPNLPEHKGIWGVDIATGRMIWRNDELTFAFILDNVLYATKTLFDKRVVYALQLHLGEILQTYDADDEELINLRKRSMPDDLNAAYLFPERYDPDSVSALFRTMIEREIKGESVVGEVEYISSGEYIVMSYYVSEKSTHLENRRLENRLSIYDLNKRTRVYFDVLNRNVQMPLPDSFFARGERIYYIKDQHTLVALELWKGSGSS